jgi:RimJ/RimL family protein N-acetyltransferase
VIDYGYGDIALGPIQSYDLEKMREWRNDVRIRKWCRQYDLISTDDQLEWYQRMRKDPTIRMFRIQTKDKFIGICGLTSIDMVNRRAEFSLYLGPQHQGQGFAMPALMTLIHHGFNTYGLNVIWGESFEGNKAMRLFEAIGFKKEGTRREFYYRDGEYIDAHLYSITRNDWLDSRRPKKPPKPYRGQPGESLQ